MAKKSQKRARKDLWPNRRGQVIAGGLVAGFLLFGLVVPLSAMQFENHDSFCAACHTEGETTFYDRSTAAPSVDLASFHATRHAARCIDCHTAPGLIGRYGGLMAGASDLVSYFSGHYPQPAIQDNPIGDGNCTKCHADILTDQAFNNHFHVFLPRWQALDPRNAAGCVDCHVSHDTANDAGAVFLSQKTTINICQKCHQFAGQG